MAERLTGIVSTGGCCKGLIYLGWDPVDLGCALSYESPDSSAAFDGLAGEVTEILMFEILFWNLF
jgi:hypothetical protein